MTVRAINPIGLLDPWHCHYPVSVGRKKFRQCKRWIHEWIEGHGYCRPHAKMVRP